MNVKFCAFGQTRLKPRPEVSPVAAGKVVPHNERWIPPFLADKQTSASLHSGLLRPNPVGWLNFQGFGW